MMVGVWVHAWMVATERRRAEREDQFWADKWGE
jgi:hypothetical protein